MLHFTKKFVLFCVFYRFISLGVNIIPEDEKTKMRHYLEVE